MKRSLLTSSYNQFHSFNDALNKRRGSTLIIVLALLGLLTMLGFVFFTFASQERENAENFSEALKEVQESPDDGFNYALQTMLLGPPQGRYNSAITAHHSIVQNLAGTDSRPLTGAGRTIGQIIQTIPESNNGGQAVAGLSLSVAARQGFPVNSRTNPLPGADVDYDYVDHNSVFLGYVGTTVRQVLSSGVLEQIPVIIPSYFRPAFMPDTTGTRPLNPNWHGGTSLTGMPRSDMTFRPHPEHVYVTRQGQPIVSGGSPIRRFLHPANDSGIISSLPGGSGPFPFTPTANVDGDPSIDGQMGVLTSPTAELNPASGVSQLTIFELDVDNDGDGTPDSNWMDLDYSLLEDPATGAKYTLLHAALVVDMDSLINLNTSGNIANLHKTPASFRHASAPLGDSYSTSIPQTSLQGRTKSISESDLGLTPSEINPTWPMLRPTPGTVTSRILISTWHTSVMLHC